MTDHEFRVDNPAGNSPEAAHEIEQTVDDARADYEEMVSLDTADWYGPNSHAVLTEAIRSSLASEGVVSPERVTTILASDSLPYDTAQSGLFSRLETAVTQEDN